MFIIGTRRLIVVEEGVYVTKRPSTTGMDFLVGTFRSPTIYTLRFTPPSTLEVVHTSTAFGGHSWLALSKDHLVLYATCWSSPPAVAAYKLNKDNSVTLLNTKEIKSLSGYVACNDTHLFSVGGPSGEVFAIAADGSIGDLVQELSFRKESELQDGARSVAHGNFGGLRHGSHSVDLSPDGRSLYVADIGHNCIWTYSIAKEAAAGNEVVSLRSKHISPRSHDGPRHTWPHPNGKVLYSLQEHSSMVDVFSIADDGVTLKHINGVKIIPDGRDPKDYWADEVRLSTSFGAKPRYLYASTRGLEADTKGYVAAFALDSEGMILGDALDIYETATSGGLANAIEPAPAGSHGLNGDYLALTDSSEGLVFVYSFDGLDFDEVARCKLVGVREEVVQAATAVWI